ncbi:MAG: hypothetical protein K0R92_608 [Lachnospiraceae bacterium]|jgi:spore germination protein|nr:hypothetical protein [Lachnospiraceae bacterium]
MGLTMVIHVVQAGETITSIAEMYGVPVEQLIKDNGLPNSNDLVVGQCIVIVYPELTYTIQEGDTLDSIARSNNISVIQLLRNNPFLSDREFLYPGETLVISYGEKKDSITTNGYANPFIDREILKKTLPFLTYLSIFGYRVTENADIIEPGDDDLIQLARVYHVAPVMVLSTLSFQGIGSAEAAYHILYNENLVNRYINNILITLRRKGLYGVSFIYSYLISNNTDIYNKFTEKITQRLNREGFAVFISLPPMMIVEKNTLSFEKIDYSEIGKYANQIVVMNYNWGHTYGPPMPASSIYRLRNYLEYLVTTLPTEKMTIGLSLIGYSWMLPYIAGVTRANSLTYDASIMLARETGSEILFDEESQTPYYEYIDESSGVPRKFVVWFIDARSIDALTSLVTEYNFPGIAAWNIMTYFSQMWLIINSQYEILTID